MLENADLTIIAQAPRILQYHSAMKTRLASLLLVDQKQINIKATTTEHLGFCGRKEGIAAMCVVLLKEQTS